jgi:hypothetical protein
VLADHFVIPTAYLHEGMLPKTMTFDPRGMMAEAESVGAGLSLHHGQPRAADRRWVAQAESVITTIRDKNLDRKPLSQIDLGDAVRAQADALGAKLVFYAGINDWHSGNLPADGGPLHSPLFKDTYDGLEALLEVAEQNDWLILFKPHPNLYPKVVPPHPRLFIVREANTLECMKISDVVVTILSSLVYLSMAHDKPTVLLGRNTLSKTGAAYELEHRGDLAAVINEAVAAVDFDDRAQAFRHHIAALLRDHLYVYDPQDTLAQLDHTTLVQNLVKRLLKRKT